MYGRLLLMVVLCGACVVGGCAAERRTTARADVVDLDGLPTLTVPTDAYRRGFAIGQAYAKRLQRLVPRTLERADDRLVDRLEADPVAAATIDAALDRLTERLLSGALPTVGIELRGLADGSGVPIRELARYNALHAVLAEFALVGAMVARGHPRTFWALREAAAIFVPAPGLDAAWQPVLLDVDDTPSDRAASLASSPKRRLEVRQLGMLWPIAVSTSRGVFATAVTADVDPTAAGWSLALALAEDAADAASATDLLFRLRQRQLMPTAELMVADLSGHYAIASLHDDQLIERAWYPGVPGVASPAELAIVAGFADHPGEVLAQLGAAMAPAAAGAHRVSIALEWPAARLVLRRDGRPPLTLELSSAEPLRPSGTWPAEKDQ